MLSCKYTKLLSSLLPLCFNSLADSNTDYDIDYYSQLETDAVKFSAKSELKGAAALADPAVPAQMKKAAQL